MDLGMSLYSGRRLSESKGFNVDLGKSKVMVSGGIRGCILKEGG